MEACVMPFVMPNVRAKRATTVARQARAVENATAPRTGPGGLPLALRLSEGLGISSWDTLKRMDLHARDSASRSALGQEQSQYPASTVHSADLAWRCTSYSDDHELKFLAPTLCTWR